MIPNDMARDREMRESSEYQGKRLLVLGGAVQCAKVVEAARKMGVYTIVADWSADSPAKRIADEAITISVMDTNGLIEWITSHPVDGVLNYCVDYAQMTHQKVCEHFGFPCYGTEEQYRILNEKRLFKKLCRDNGVDVIPDYTVEDISGGRVEYPVIVKPSDSSGSRGVKVCFTEGEAAVAISAAKEESKDGIALIEKYMGGKQDFIAAYVVTDGKVNLLRTGDRFLGAKENGLDRQGICTICPSRFTDRYLQTVNPKVVRMIENLGVKNGPIFIQGFIDGDTVRFYDPGIRFPGGEYDRVFCLATGIDIVSMMIGYSLGGQLTDCDGRLEKGYQLDGKCAVTLCIDSAPGEIRVFDLDAVEQIAGVVNVARKAKVGSVIPESGDVKQRIAEVVLLIENDSDLIKEKIREVQACIRVRGAAGENMIVSAMDVSLIREKRGD